MSSKKRESGSEMLGESIDYSGPFTPFPEEVNLISTVQVPNDNRFYIQCKLISESMTGLLDSGANITLVNSDNVLKKLGIPISPTTTTVITAGGERHKAEYYAEIPFVFQNQCKIIPTLILPGFTHSLLLGITFWHAFNIVPSICQPISTEVLNVESNGNTPGEQAEETNNPISLTEDQSQALERVKKEFPLTVENKLGRTHLLAHDIDTGDATPVKQNFYTYSPYVQKEIESELDRMLAADVVQTSRSPWNSPIVTVKKPNGKTRICLDLRRVNKLTVKKDAYPLPHISGILGRIQGTNFISGIDLKDAYWQIPLTKNTQEKTAFTVPGRGLFEYKVMPFGCATGSQTMSRLMDLVLGKDLEPKVFFYLDDIIVVTDTFDEHIRVLSIVAKRLKEAGLTISIEKSRFLIPSIEFLGYVIDQNGLHVNPNKVSCIVNYPVPKDVREVRRFLGMTGYYRRFVDNFAQIAVPLTNLIKKGKGKLIWTAEANVAFNKLKEALISAPVLTSPDWTQMFTIHADASDHAIGAVITQGDEGQEKPIAFMSRKLIGSQYRYTTTEKECLAVILAIEHFRGFVEGIHFKVVTDHASLVWLRNMKFKSNRLARWLTWLECFDFEVHHKKGKLNVVPDALSRLYGVSDDPEVCIVDIVPEEDPKYVVLRRDIQLNPKEYPTMVVLGGKVYRHCKSTKPHDQDFEWKLFVPKTDVEKVLFECHHEPTAAHFGLNKTLERVKLNYYWPDLAKDVYEYVSKCAICKAIKAPNYCIRNPLVCHAVPQRKFEVIAVDFISHLPRSKKGNTAIFVMVDLLTKFPLVYVARQADAKTMCEFLEATFLLFGTPRVVISDNGKQFESNLFNELLEEYKIQSFLTPYHHPQANPCERVNRVIVTSICAFHAKFHLDWDINLPAIMAAIRSAVHESTKYSPYFLTFGQEMCLSGQYAPNLSDDNVQSVNDRNEANKRLLEIVRKNIYDAQQRQKKYYDRFSAPKEYQVGENVYRQNYRLSSAKDKYSHKLDHKFIPCTVEEKLGSGCYLVKDFGTGKLGRYHANNLKPGLKIPQTS